MVLAVPLLGLAACGENMGDRAMSGAGIGAGVGLLGMVTSPGQVDLGRPAWR